MTAKEYLGQAFFLDRRIESNLEQLSSLKLLATKTTARYDDMPGSPGRNTDGFERTMVKIIALSQEINDEIDRLVDLKTEMTHRINQVEDAELCTLLELRYLCFKSWEDIAVDMHYTERYIHLLHSKALCCIEKMLAH